MSRKVKILLGIFIPVIVIGASISTIFLVTNWPAVWNREAPIIAFPLESSDSVEGIFGYGDHNGEFHNGIDFICNTSVEIVAWCKLRVVMITTFVNEINGFWQTNVKFKYNWKYEFEALFESLAQNETFANLQRDAIQVKFGQVVEPGETIGTLLLHSSITILHFGAKVSGIDECAYQFFTSSAKVTFLDLWNIYGYGDSSYYNSTIS